MSYQIYNSWMCFSRAAVTKYRKQLCYFYPWTWTLIIYLNENKGFKKSLSDSVLHEIHLVEELDLLPSVYYSESVVRWKQSLLIIVRSPHNLQITETCPDRLSHINSSWFSKLLPSWACLLNPDTLMMDYIWPVSQAKKPSCL